MSTLNTRLIAPVLIALASGVVAQRPDPARPASGGTVRGVVYDSLSHAPLRAAMVQIVSADNQGRSVVADSLGAFTFDGLSAGRYTLGFFHPVLDSLGVEPPPRQIVVAETKTVHADLGIPSPRSLRAAVCGKKPDADSTALLIGTIRGARDYAPVPDVTVTGEWVELAVTREGLVRHVPRLVAKTGPNGWFALCNVPSGALVSLLATRGSDSTDHIDVAVSPDGFARRELYLGTGGAKLSGVVLATQSGQPLANAQISLVNGPETRADARGEWSIPNAPAGTHMLEVRAIGYFPERRAVDVVDGAPAVRTSLSTMRTVLDTVRVGAARAERHFSGFEDRRRAGIGVYLTAEDIARRNAGETSRLLRTINGIRVEPSGPAMDTSLVDVDPTRAGMLVLMRGLMKDWCAPAIFMDGYYVGDLTAEDIDAWVKPSQVIGIEIYRGPVIPPQFDRGMAGVGPAGEVHGQVRICGSIVFWTR